MKSIGGTLSQELINELIELCNKGVRLDSPEWTDFCGELRNLEQISPA
jgi:hypothetical protein